MHINQKYVDLLGSVIDYGDELMTRNHSVFSRVEGLRVSIKSFPLVTVRRTAWKKALLEMEWFMSGETQCPNELLDWWGDQLNPHQKYYCGYGVQLRTASTPKNRDGWYDQVEFVHKALAAHPNSRRIITTTWNPYEMDVITEINDNPLTPTTCHGTISQFFVRDQTLSMTTYQRSADLLLGVPHNWVQYWALLQYYAYHAGLRVGNMTWLFGDAHIYNEPSHLEVTNILLDATILPKTTHNLEYSYSGDRDDKGVPVFKASDFKLTGDPLPEPLTKIRPKLL